LNLDLFIEDNIPTNLKKYLKSDNNLEYPIIDDTNYNSNDDPSISYDDGYLTELRIFAARKYKKLGDKKLVRQIGNVLTYFTRTQISSDEDMQ
jgi:hypothetical protein